MRSKLCREDGIPTNHDNEDVDYDHDFIMLEDGRAGQN